MLNVLQSRAVGPSFVLDRSGSFSFVWSRFISRSMILLPRLKSFSLPGPVILLAQLPSPVYKGYGSSSSALHRHGVCFRFVCKRIEHAPNRKKSLHVKHEKFKFFRRTKRYAKKKKKLWDANSGILNLKLSTEYLKFKT